jgi:hypothetical protein
MGCQVQLDGKSDSRGWDVRFKWTGRQVQVDGTSGSSGWNVRFNWMGRQVQVDGTSGSSAQPSKFTHVDWTLGLVDGLLGSLC